MEFLWGNAQKAERELGWKRAEWILNAKLVAMMMVSDMKDMKAIAGMDCREYREKRHNK